MRRLAFLFLLYFFISSNSYAFWIWSPKTQKWKNPQLASLAAPQLQLRKALKFFKKKEYKRALKEFRKLINQFPDSFEASEAQYYIGRCWEELKRHYKAFSAYHKLVTTYPNSKRIQEVLEREYKIGEYFFNQPSKNFLGISLYEFVEHPSLEIFRKIAEDFPYSKYAPASLYKVGIILMELKRWEEAEEFFRKVVDNYPESEWYDLAKFQLSRVYTKLSYGSDYDDVYYQEAEKGFEEFLKRNPQADMSQKAKKILKQVREKQAKKYFEVAQFYKKQKKKESAVIYYKLVIEKFPHTGYAERAKKELQKLK